MFLVLIYCFHEFFVIFFKTIYIVTNFFVPFVFLSFKFFCLNHVKHYLNNVLLLFFHLTHLSLIELLFLFSFWQWSVYFIIWSIKSFFNIFCNIFINIICFYVYNKTNLRSLCFFTFRMVFSDAALFINLKKPLFQNHFLLFFILSSKKGKPLWKLCKFSGYWISNSRKDPLSLSSLKLFIKFSSNLEIHLTHLSFSTGEFCDIANPYKLYMFQYVIHNDSLFLA